MDMRTGTDPTGYGNALAEDVAYLETGIDGMFCDQPDICLEARKDLLAGR